MKTKTEFNFDDDDRHWQSDIDEAFNLVYEFCLELRNPNDRQKDRSPQLVAFNRIVTGNCFDERDVRILNAYAQKVVASIRECYTNTDRAAAPWKDSVMQNADRLESVLKEFVASFKLKNPVDEYRTRLEAMFEVRSSGVAPVKMSTESPEQPDIGDLIPVKDWLAMCDDGSFTDYDGHGQLAMQLPDSTWRMATVRLLPSDITILKLKLPDWATHVLWFNK